MTLFLQSDMMIIFQDSGICLGLGFLGECPSPAYADLPHQTRRDTPLPVPTPIDKQTY